ncbi:hypothetical protein MPSEU_000102200 [Mayamaea pseudoterrestris]|nr:hypothetical protein MPSEU_000102200 [Mayamaea pseudoterrestris]
MTSTFNDNSALENEQQPMKTQSILSEKVSRALQVRTDTPAMAAALEALGQIQSTGPTSGTFSSSKQVSSTAVVDSRTVRAAMEQDALAQALQLQSQVKGLVQAVRDVREQISETANFARQVSKAIQANVIVDENSNSGIVGMVKRNDEVFNETTSEELVSSDSTIVSAMNAVPMTTALQEQLLAGRLHEAFVHRDAAKQRVEAVHAFFDRFDLSPQEARLLEQYSFEDVSLNLDEDETLMHSGSDSDSMPANGVAFLRALERLRRVRRALTETFGSPRDISMATTSNTGNSMQKDGLAPSSALRMMERLAQTQERAYERLYHWLQSYLHLSHQSAPTSSSAMQQQQLPNSTAAEGLEEAIQHPFVQLALHTLRHVPAFYTHTLELIASSRRTEQTKRFLLALTTTNSGLATAPLELKSQSQDPVGYTADLLAWAFSAFSVEADVAKGLFRRHARGSGLTHGSDGVNELNDESHNSSRREDSVEDEDDTFRGDDDGMFSSIDKPMTAQDMLAMSMSGLARPLKSRIMQVIARLARRPDQDGNEDNDEDDDGHDGLDDFEEEGRVQRNRVAHLYELCGLLLFYTSVMETTINKLQLHGSEASTAVTKEDEGGNSDSRGAEQNPLLTSLVECFAEATKAYEATVRVYAAVMGQLSASTGESESALTHLLLVKIAQVRQQSPGFAKDVECPEAYADILLIDWVTHILIQAAIASCRTLDDAVTLQQSVAASKQAGMKIVAAEQLDEAIEAKEVVLIQQLVAQESNKVLDLCGLGQVTANLMLWQEVQGGGTQMVAYPGLSPQEVEAGLKEFYASLYSPPIPSLETTVKDPVLRKNARSKIAESVCETYERLYEAISSPAHGGYDDTSFLGHTPDQVRTLIMH